MLTVGGADWRLHLPSAWEATLEASADTPVHLASSELRFRVSSDEEFVELSLLHEGGELALRPRAHHYVLLTLARARLKDAAEGGRPADHGWLYAEELARMLGVDDMHLNTDIYRARKQLGSRGVQGAAGLVERRRSTRQLRLGVERARVERL